VGNVWELRGKCLGNVWNFLILIINTLNTFRGKCLGIVWEMFGKCLGNFLGFEGGLGGNCLGKLRGGYKKKIKKSVKMFFSTQIVFIFVLKKLK
jgi:hypothetical protein